MKKLFKREQGFTIIEVVLVLAIAGLIFLVVFLALPQLQRSRRDTQRRSDTGRILAAMETYASNHNGVYPVDSTTDAATNFGANKNDSNSFLAVYFGADNFSDPSAGEYEHVATLSRPGDIDYQTGVDCDGNAGGRYVMVRMQLEQDTFCQDNR